MKLRLILEGEHGELIAEEAGVIVEKDTGEILRRLEVLGHRLARETVGPEVYARQILDPALRWVRNG